ncbi:MAG TPA: GNAT family N-acetyltransferase [Ramlibacter sp.]|nr:GNAT family N-acetyltransferase [Ramlibacter sp.]
MRVLRAGELGEAHWAAWLAFHRANPLLASPCFHPQFARGLVASDYDVQVAVAERDGAVEALFGFERDGRRGRPMGAPMNDFQGVIAAPGGAFDTHALMRAAGLRTMAFDHLLQDLQVLGEHVERVQPSPYCDIGGGLDAYRARLGRGKTALSTTLQLARKAARELGELRLDFQCTDPAVLDTLFAWKSRQYRDTGVHDLFAEERPRRFLRWMFDQREPVDGFCGVMTTLHAGDQLLAVHLGMRAGHVLHSWFPSYNTTLRKYSPGRILLAKIAEAAPALGLARIDLGKGREMYKAHSMTGSVAVCEGRIETGTLQRVFGRRQRALIAALRESAAWEQLRALKRRYLRARLDGRDSAALPSPHPDEN